MATVKKKTVKKKRKPLGSGKFTKGNQHGKKSRNPEATRKLDLVEVFKNAVSFDDIKDIAKKLVEKAKAGDTKAAQQVLDRCLGKVKDTTEITGADGGPVQIVNYAGAAKQ